jgi:hypothetical protein
MLTTVVIRGNLRNTCIIRLLETLKVILRGAANFISCLENALLGHEDFIDFFEGLASRLGVENLEISQWFKEFGDFEMIGLN